MAPEPCSLGTPDTAKEPCEPPPDSLASCSLTCGMFRGGLSGAPVQPGKGI